MKKCKTCGWIIPGLICSNPKCGVLQPKIGPKIFDEFKRMVNVQVLRIAGVEADDLPDYYDYHQAWKNNKTPLQAARAALKAAGFPLK